MKEDRRVFTIEHTLIERMTPHKICKCANTPPIVFCFYKFHLFFFFSIAYTTSPASVMKFVVFFRSSNPPSNFWWSGVANGHCAIRSGWCLSHLWRTCLVVWSSSPQGHVGEGTICRFPVHVCTSNSGIYTDIRSYHTMYFVNITILNFTLPLSMYCDMSTVYCNRSYLAISCSNVVSDFELLLCLDKWMQCKYNLN